MRIAAITSRFRFYAESHVNPWSFFPFNDEELVNKIKGTKGRILYLDNWKKFPSGTDAYIRENLQLSFYLIDSAVRGDNENMQDVIDSCEEDAWDLLSRLRSDTYPHSINPVVITNFDFKSATIVPTQWLADNRIGVLVTITFHSQRSMAYQTIKWSD
jgi:hypothetical protein